MADPDTIPVNPKALLGALEDCQGIVAQVDASCGALTDPDDLWALLEMTRDLRSRNFLGALDDRLVGLLHSAIEGRAHKLSDGRTIIKSVTRESERWDGAALTSQVASRVSDDVVDRETGEVPPIAVICEKTANVMAQALGGLAPSTKWRLTPLRSLGIDPSKYRTSEPGRPKVELERGYGRA